MTGWNDFVRALGWVPESFFFMAQDQFDVIIDDLFLDGAARVRAQKYHNKFNPTAIKIISEINDEGKKKLRNA